MSGKWTCKVRFDCCLDRNCQIQYMRSVHGHSGGQHVDPQLQNNVICVFADGVIAFITWDYRLITGPFVKDVSLQVE